MVTFTLSANASSTVLSDGRLVEGRVLDLDPMTANAAAEKASGTLYALSADRSAGQWTFAHANNAQTDRTFAVIFA